MDERTTKSPSEKSRKLRPYQAPRLVSFGQVELLTKTGGNTTVDEDARKKVAG
jgi:hypothetical protein